MITQLNKYLQPLNTPVTADRPTNAVDFEINNDIQARRIRASSLDTANMVKDIGQGTTTRGTADWGGEFSNNITLITIFTLEAAPSVKKDVTNVTAIPLISIYQGTGVDSNYQIYPQTGGSISNNAFYISSGYEAGTVSNQQVVWKTNIYNNNGGTVNNLTYVNNWRFIANFNQIYTE